MRRLAEEYAYAPELLLARWPEHRQHAELSPASAWKLADLMRRPQRRRATTRKQNRPDTFTMSDLRKFWSRGQDLNL